MTPPSTFHLPSPVGVIGGGSWGTCVAHVAATGHRDVLLRVRGKDLVKEINSKHANSRYLPGAALDHRVRAVTSLEEVCNACRVVFVIVPSKYFRATLQEM